jgi:hypothetical protein
MLNDCNMTSHTYDELLADVIFMRIRDYVPLIKKACEDLEKILADFRL